MPTQDQIRALHAEKAILLALLNKSKHHFFLHLPKDVENDFYQSLHRKWIHLGKNHLPIAFLLYLGFFIITAGGFLLFVGNLSSPDILFFMVSYLSPIIAVLFLTRFYSTRITRNTIQAITLGTCVANIFCNVVLSYCIENRYLHVQANLGIIYLFFLYYMLTGLPLKRLFLAINLAFISSFVLLKLFNIQFALWMFVINTFVPNTTFFLFMYIFRNGDRLNFLQSKILDIDHTIQMLQQQQLEVMSQQDSLTQLLTRRAFDVIFQDILLNSHAQQQHSLLFIDIDHFKKYNDHYGHIQGDKAIVHVAKRLKNTLRSTDAISRYGGEEFVVLLPNTHYQDALQIGEKLLDQLRKDQLPHVDSDHQMLTISIGLTSFSAASLDDAESIIDLADQALYAAKAHGRNRIYMMLPQQIHPHDSSESVKNESINQEKTFNQSGV